MSRGTFIALSPKCYMAFNQETEETKLGTKGVPRRAKLELDHFLAKLYNKSPHSVDVRSLRMMNNRMARTIQRKSALNDLFLKFSVHSDRVTCSPLREDGVIL